MFWPIFNHLSAAAAAKSLQLCPTLHDPIDGSLPGSSVHRILQARILEWVAISFSNAWKWKVKSFSHVRLLATPWTAAYQAPLSMGFSRQEYWRGVPLPSPWSNQLGLVMYNEGLIPYMSEQGSLDEDKSSIAGELTSLPHSPPHMCQAHLL